MRRYSRTPILGFGSSFGTSYAIPIIRENIANGNIRYNSIILKEADRLDIIAGRVYGESTFSWIIAAASGIGYELQCPPGTVVKIPVLEDVKKYLG